MSFKKCQVVMLSTNEKANSVSDLILFKGKLRKCSAGGEFRRLLSEGGTAYSLYILSDEEIKKGDWVCDGSDEPYQWTKGDVEDCLYNLDAKDYKGCKKIIATTDKSLGADYNGAFGGLGKSPQPSQSFIEKFVEEYNKGNVIIDVMVEYETITKRYGSCSIGEGVTMNVEQLKVSKDNTITIRKVKDSWSREEVEEKIRQGAYVILNGSLGDFDKWIEENL